MSAPKQIGWLVGPSGEVTKYNAQQKRREIRLRNSADLHARARIGLIYVLEVLKRCGWHCNCVEQSSTSISLEASGLSVDVSIRKPSMIAYVTSRPGWEYRREVVGKTPQGQELARPTSEVKLASSFIEDPWVVQIIATSKKGNSTTPIYVEVTKEGSDPALEVAKHILLTLKNLVGADKFQIHVNSALNALDEGAIDVTSAESEYPKLPSSC